MPRRIGPTLSPNTSRPAQLALAEVFSCGPAEVRAAPSLGFRGSQPAVSAAIASSGESLERNLLAAWEKQALVSRHEPNSIGTTKATVTLAGPSCTFKRRGQLVSVLA